MTGDTEVIESNHLETLSLKNILAFLLGYPSFALVERHSHIGGVVGLSQYMYVYMTGTVS